MECSHSKWDTHFLIKLASKYWIYQSILYNTVWLAELLHELLLLLLLFNINKTKSGVIDHLQLKNGKSDYVWILGFTSRPE